MHDRLIGQERLRSPNAARQLVQRIEDGELDPFSIDADDAMGETDCSHGCSVEPDGKCPHGYDSAAVTAGLI